MFADKPVEAQVELRGGPKVTAEGY